MHQIKCPDCGNTLPTERIMQDRATGNARGQCQKCKKLVPILLPSIRKKLIYLDQSFLSAASLRADSDKSQSEVRILSKLRELKALQRVFVVISDIHSRETSSFQDECTGKILWQFQNDLADGNIAADWDEVFVAQWQRILADKDNSNIFPTSDIGINNPHRFQIGMRVQPTNHWRQRLHRGDASTRDEVNKFFHSVFDRRLIGMPSAENAYDCVSYVYEIWHKEIQEGIISWQKRRDLHLPMRQAVKELEAGPIPALPPYEKPSPFCQIVGEVAQGSNEDVSLQAWLKLLDEKPANWSAYVRIRAAFEAALLWKYKMDGAPSNPDKFNTRFGRSRQNDIDHVSMFVPYVDALTTDKDMHNLCENEVVAGELRQFPCKLFSKNNYNEFETWLDALLSGSVDS